MQETGKSRVKPFISHGTRASGENNIALWVAAAGQNEAGLNLTVAQGLNAGGVIAPFSNAGFTATADTRTAGRGDRLLMLFHGR